jgi:hypothetical protein
VIDVAKIKAGVKVKLNDGTDGVVKGSYLSSEGIVLMVNKTGGVVAQNVPLKNVTEILEGN